MSPEQIAELADNLVLAKKYDAADDWLIENRHIIARQVLAQAAEIARMRAAQTTDEHLELWASEWEETLQFLRHDVLSADWINHDRACIAEIRTILAARKTDAPQSEYAIKVAAMKKDFPNGI